MVASVHIDKSRSTCGEPVIAGKNLTLVVADVVDEE
jgi:hypothetical protein